MKHLKGRFGSWIPDTFSELNSYLRFCLVPRFETAGARRRDTARGGHPCLLPNIFSIEGEREHKKDYLIDDDFPSLVPPSAARCRVVMFVPA